MFSKLSSVCSLATLLVSFETKICLSTIYTQLVNNYIGVFDDSKTYTWSDAESHCQTFYGTSLASIHSAQDFEDCGLSRWTTTKHAWIGLNDKDSEGVWEWSDNTEYDWDITWNKNEPNNGIDDENPENCVQIVKEEENYLDSSSAAANDIPCYFHYDQFICNSPLIVGYESTAIVMNRNEEVLNELSSLEENELFVPLIIVSCLLLLFCLGASGFGLFYLLHNKKAKKLESQTESEIEDTDRQTLAMLPNGYNQARQDDDGDELNNSHDIDRDDNDDNEAGREDV